MLEKFWTIFSLNTAMPLKYDTGGQSSTTNRRNTCKYQKAMFDILSNEKTVFFSSVALNEMFLVLLLGEVRDLPMRHMSYGIINPECMIFNSAIAIYS